MLDRLSDFLDRFLDLPYWQMGVLAVLTVALAAGGYFILRPPARPDSDFQAVEEAGLHAGPQELTVHVSGAVTHPGVVLLAEGDRVIDAIEAAGGPLPEADLDGLNLALTVQDGQKIAVPLRGETGGTSPGGGETQKKINLNTADAESLEGLPGIGPTLAERIISYRENQGGFRSVEELKQVSGIGDKKFEEIEGLVEI